MIKDEILYYIRESFEYAKSINLHELSEEEYEEIDSFISKVELRCNNLDGYKE